MRRSSYWRCADAGVVQAAFGDPEFVARICALVANARVAARALLRALVADAAAARSGAPPRGRAGADSLATDLFVTALLIDACAGDLAARAVVDLLRRRRLLPALGWPAGPRSGGRRVRAKARATPRAATPA